jgi:curved DNA-binding protein CbpA
MRSKCYDNHYGTDLQGTTQIMMARQQGNSDGLYLRLGVLPGASHDDVARAYRRLARDAHPDAHPQDPDAPRRFRDITEAYEVLGHPASRRRYEGARRPAGVGTGGASEAPGESPGRPGVAQVHASRTVTGGPAVLLGAAPVHRPRPGLFVGPVEVRPAPSSPPTPPTGEDIGAALLARLLSDMFEPRYRS